MELQDLVKIVVDTLDAMDLPDPRRRNLYLHLLRRLELDYDEDDILDACSVCRYHDDNVAVAVRRWKPALARGEWAPLA